MYLSKNHPNPPQKPVPPTDRGRRLATCERHDGELRVSLDEFNGHPYVSLRVWERDKQTGDLWPAKAKGLSVRITELGDVIAGMRHLEELIDRGEVQLPRRDPHDHRSSRQLATNAAHVNRKPVAGGEPAYVDPKGAGDIASPPWDDQKPQFVDKRRQGPRTWSPPPSDVPRGYLGAAEFDEFGAG